MEKTLDDDEKMDLKKHNQDFLTYKRICNEFKVRIFFLFFSFFSFCFKSKKFHLSLSLFFFESKQEFQFEIAENPLAIQITNIKGLKSKFESWFHSFVSGIFSYSI